MSIKPTNTENYFAEKLNNRMLEPSEKVWKKIQQQIQPTKKSKNKFLLYVPVAAALLILGLVYIQQTNEAYKPTNTNEKPIQQVVIEKDSLRKQNIFLNKKTIKMSVAEAHNKNIDKNTELKTTEITDNQLVETTQIHGLSTENSLAENTTTINKKTFPKLKIDLKNLLDETETEVIKGFREKVIEKIATNYKLVKEAYVNRNYEKPND